MENSEPTKKELSELEQAQQNFTQRLNARKAEIEEKFNLVNKKLNQLKEESNKLLYPDTPKQG